VTLSYLKRVLVTGAAGFVGSHLVRHLLNRPEPPESIIALDLRPGKSDPRVCWVKADLADTPQVHRTLVDYEPSAVAHLAAAPPRTDLKTCFEVNVRACSNLLAAVAARPRPPRMLIVGSAAQYGIDPGGCEVVDESHPLNVTTPYGLSKTLQESWAMLYARDGGVPVIAVRPFNILGPGQPSGLVPAAFLHQVAEVAAGRAAEVRVGNTSTLRDFTDVRDVAAAMALLLAADEKVDGEVFNIASGEAVGIREMLVECIRLAGRDIPVREDLARLRPGDVPSITGDAGKLRKATGWQPRIPWRRSLADMWDALSPAV
jgi:GDP-4-dehydro-6-deoxy-D-mannose reductase